MDASVMADTRLSSDHSHDGFTDKSYKEEEVSSSIIDGNSSRVLEHENKFQSAISSWRHIDLTKLVPELDVVASDIVSHQKEALLSRKDLAQKTKDFRKLDDATKLGEFKSLLKAYQTFIDLLTNHGKTTSTAFLQLYSSISEAPDPYPLLEASVDALLISEDTLPKITLENEHLQKSVANLTSQLDILDRRFEEERASKKEIEESRDTKVKEVESSWKAVIDEKRDNWEARERSLVEKIENQDRLLNELKASYEVAQRLEHSVTGDDSRMNSASVAELEIVNSDLDRTSQRLAEVEARNEQLRIELAEVSSKTEQKPIIEEDPTTLHLRSQNSSLLRKIDAMRVEKDSETRKNENRIRTLERDAQTLQREREILRERVNSWRDYTDIKRELDIFKSIELSTLQDDDFKPHTDFDDHSNHKDGQSNGAVRDGKTETLEQMLLARNKKLSNEMAVLRVSHQDLQRQSQALQETMRKTKLELEQAQDLNATLEADLSKIQHETSSALPSSAMSNIGTYTSRYPASTYNSNSLGGRRGRSSPTSSIISGFDPSNNPRNTLEAVRAGEPIGGGSGILPMIQAQRDRFKQKNLQLEEELSKQCSTVSSLRQEVASLQKDNLNLYEKSRYVSTFNRGQQSSSASSYAPKPSSTAIQVSSDTPSGLSLDRYRSAYEANISPFAAFRGRESTRAYKRMSLPERIVYSITRMVLANRTSRNIFASYCFALHILVFVMLYWMQSVDIRKHASNLSETVGVFAGGSPGSGADIQPSNWHPEGFHSEQS